MIGCFFKLLLGSLEEILDGEPLMEISEEERYRFWENCTLTETMETLPMETLLESLLKELIIEIFAYWNFDDYYAGNVQ